MEVNYFYYVVIPMEDVGRAEEHLQLINRLCAEGWMPVYQQLMIYKGQPCLVVSLVNALAMAGMGLSAKMQQHQPTNDAESLPPPARYDPNAGLAEPFPSYIERNEVREL